MVPQTIQRTTFSKVLASTWDTDYWIRVNLGSGQANSQSAGNGVITSGTTVNTETILRSDKSFIGSFVLKAQTILSQRIANQNFYVEMVDVIGDGLVLTGVSATSCTVTIPNNPFTSENVGQAMHIGAIAPGSIPGIQLPGRYVIASVSGNVVTFTVAGWTGATSGTGTCSLFGWNYHQLLYNSTTATQASYDAQRNGWAQGATTATINTSASPGHMAIMGSEDGVAFLADQLIASATTLPILTRASRVASIAKEDVPLWIQIRCVNGSTAPASTTTWTIGTIALENYATIPVQLSSAKVQSASTAQSVRVENTPAVTVSSGTVTTVSTVTSLTTLANGQTADDAATTGNPLRIGGRVKTANVTTYVAGDAANISVTTDGSLIAKPYAAPELDWQFACTAPIANTSDVVLKAAAGASVRNYITGIQIVNSSATIATEVVVKDGATVIWRGYVGIGTTLNSSVGIIFQTPLKSTANTALNFACITTASSVYVNSQGYIAP